VEIALNVRFRPANVTVSKALYQQANFGCRQGHK